MPKHPLDMVDGREVAGDEAGQVVDEASLRALAHPIRWSLIEVLSVEGPATAARCAQIIGQSQGACSFHLRQLARFGLVEHSPTESRRDRPWRLTSIRRSWSGRPTGDAGRDLAAQELSQVFVHRETERIRRWVRDEPQAPTEWRSAAFRTGVLTWMTADELDEMAGALSQLMQTFVDRIEDSERRPFGSTPVRLFTTGFPVFELAPGADGDAATTECEDDRAT